MIYEHAIRLLGRGHQVTVVTRSAVQPESYAWHPAAGSLTWLSLAQAEKREFDLVLATWWQSPFLLHQLHADHYAYFVQSIESRFFEEEDPQDHDRRELSVWKQFCESTYSFALPVITEAAWIQEYLHTHYNTNAFLVRNGIRKDLYRARGGLAGPRREGGFRVLVEGPVDVPYKNVPRSVQLCRQAGVDEIWLLTSSTVSGFPGVDRVFSRIPIHETPAIYRSCDVLVKLSYIEGMFGPPLEMFHCGGTAVVYNVTGHDEYIEHDKNSLVVKKDDENQVVACLRMLRSSPDVLKRLKRGAAETAASWPDWEDSTEEFARAIQSICKQKKIARNYPALHAERLISAKDAALAARDLDFFVQREKNRGAAGESCDNFVQVYWHQGEGFNQDHCQALHYKSGTWVSLLCEVEMNGRPFWIRIDPSVRLGMIELRLIEIVNSRTGRRVMVLSRPDDFDTLSPAGTVNRMKLRDRAVYCSYGSDPQLLLPAIEDGEDRDHLNIKLVLRETGVSQFVDEHCQARDAAAGPGKTPSAGRRSFWQRLAAGLSSIFPADEK